MRRFVYSRPFQRLSVPGTLLLAILQRSPAVRVVGQAEALLAGSPIGHVLRSVLTAVASLGALHSLAGATTLVAAPSNAVNGVTTSVGGAVNVFFTVNGTLAAPQSWQVTGDIPPGLNFSGVTGGGGIVNVSNLNLTGSATTAGTYTMAITAFQGPSGSLTSSPQFGYTITVTGGGGGGTNTAPAFTTQPQSQTVTAGANVTFTVAASGTPSPTLQWRKDGTTIASATGATLSLNNVSATDAGSYTVVATNAAGTATSNAAVLTVNPAGGPAPAFTLQPSSQTIAAGGTVVFNALATAATGYRWQRNGTDIAGATGPILVIASASAANSGTYAAVASNSGGAVTSNVATLTVNTTGPADVGRLSNLSVRTTSGAGDQVLSVGFSVGGSGVSGTKPLLIRVTGPALAAFGVGGTMADPTLTTRPLGSSTIVAQNDDWAGDPAVASVSNALGAFPLTDVAGKDAAAVVSVSPGAYTTVAAGKNNGTGVVLTEIYDATPGGTFSATTPRLVNISARAQASAGDGALTAGFFITGSTARTVLIRATGPALAGFGVGGALSDPKLQLHVLNGPLLYENDNWGGAQVLADAANSVSAFPIADTASKDAVLLVTLPPGGYTAQVTGVGTAAGVALVEVYELP